MKNYPEAVWPYSPFYKSWNTLYCSGQIGLIPETMKIIEWGVEKETSQLISNIWWVLKENWLDFSNVVKTTIYLDNIKDFTKVNEIYAKYFSHKPARSTVEVSKLPLWALVEIEVIAII
jgi:2-iminobutanoate/2-iminopropanoate deaminase